MQHKFFWLWVPVVFLFIQIVLEISLSHEVLASLHSESGPHELLQFLIILMAAIVALRLLFVPQTRQNIFLTGWVGIAFLASVYIAGEEMSWGQHVLEWESPEYWKNINDQGETNFHNTSSWLDQKPRLILEIGVIVGGVLMPLLRRFSPKALPARFNLIYPTRHVIPTSVIFLGLTIADKIDEGLDGVHLFERVSEVEELYLFYFVLIYLVALRTKIRAKL